MPTILAALISGISSIFGRIVDFKGEQAKTVQGALDIIKSVDTNDAQSTAALANSLQVILSQGSWLERNWRSWLMTGLVIIIFASFFGYIPPNFNDALSPQMERIYNLVEIGLGGYIIRRGIVDIVRMFNIGSILKTFIQKKLL